MSTWSKDRSGSIRFPAADRRLVLKGEACHAEAGWRGRLYWVLVNLIPDLLCGLLIFSVLSYGAVDEWAILVVEVSSALLFLLWAMQQIAGRRLVLKSNVLYAPAAAFGGVIVAQLVLHHSAYRYATVFNGFLYVAYGIVLIIAVNCFHGEGIRRRAAIILISFGSLYAFFGIVQNLVSPGVFFWRATRISASFATYVNRNHYAGLMEMLAPVALVFALSDLLSGAKRALAAFAFILMGGSIFLSASRGGMACFTGEMVLFIVLLVRSRSDRASLLKYAALFVLLAAFLVLAGKGQITDRLHDLGPDPRTSIMKDTLRLWEGNPWLGWGLGTFETVYPGYRSFYLDKTVNAAHNDYMQVLAEMGVAGLVTILWFVVVLYLKAASRLNHWRDNWDRALSFAAMIACSGILLHGFLDFNFQIPANAMFFIFMAGLATSGSERVYYRRSEVDNE